MTAPKAVQFINSQPIEKQVNENTLDVHSIFYTIQGEGPFVGRPAIFIRLAGCNLQCPACDTDYTNGRKQMTTAEIQDKLYDLQMEAQTYKKPMIVITGGEPFRQNIEPLIFILLELNYLIQIETNGSLYRALRFGHPNLKIVCSPKTGKINAKLLPHIDALKYVVSHGHINWRDGLPVEALFHTAAPELARPPEGFKGPIYVQPADEKDPELNAVNLKLAVKSCMEFGYTLCIQVHKIIGME